MYRETHILYNHTTWDATHTHTTNKLSYKTMLLNVPEKDFTKNEILLAPAPQSSEQTRNVMKMEDELHAFCVHHHNQVHDWTTSKETYGKEKPNQSQA